MNRSLIILSALLLVACNGLRTIKSAFTNLSPYEKYVESLKKAGLLTTSMAREWVCAGQEAFSDSVMVELPFSESGFFAASAPEARSYRFHVKDGQVLTVDGAAQTNRSTRVFVDLFVRDESEWERVAFGDSTFAVKHEFNRDQECILRVQPELLANTYYTVSISATPVLLNPVYGASNKSIGSFYGASRDNGRRSHEGVDIFAPKGTPVIAPTDGYITRVGLNTLGGKVVWMKDPQRGHSYYFAHLDSQMVKPGMRVYKGHVLGLVGNTGNAKKTPPHLHFGIYQAGSKDPLYYIRQVEGAIASLPIDTGFHQKPFKIQPRKVSLLAGPSPEMPVKSILERDTYVTVIAQTKDWYRVSLPNDSEGFVIKKHLVPLSGGKTAILDSARTLLSGIQSNALPITILEAETSVEILARYDEYAFVRTENGAAGWLYN